MDSKFVLTQGAGHKLEKAVQRNDGDMDDIEWLSKGENFKQIKIIRLKSAKLESVDETPALMNTVVLVDRSAELVPPNWIRHLYHPELEAVGPYWYDLSQVKVDQRYCGGPSAFPTGRSIYDDLCRKNEKVLKTCLGFADAVAIQKLGVKAYRHFFGEKCLVFWKGAGHSKYDRYGNHFGSSVVPYLCAHNEMICLGFRGFDQIFQEDWPAARL